MNRLTATLVVVVVACTDRVGPPGPSRYDVAYIELLRETIHLQRSLGTTLGVVPAVIGERRLMLGLSALPEGT